MQRKTALQQQLLSTPSESRKHKLETDLADSEGRITQAVARIQECEEEIQRQSDYKDKNMKRGELRILMFQHVHTSQVGRTGSIVM